MNTILLIMLVMLDVFLLGIVYFLGKQRINPIDILKDIDEERRLLKELQMSFKDEMEISEQKCRDILGKVTAIATDIDMEMKAGGESIGKEVSVVLERITNEIQEPMKNITKKQAALEALLRRVDKERLMLNKALIKGERLIKFFDKNLSYEEILRDIEDKKYMDARQMLTQGFSIPEISRELNMPESEVGLLLSIG